MNPFDGFGVKPSCYVCNRFARQAIIGKNIPDDRITPLKLYYYYNEISHMTWRQSRGFLDLRLRLSAFGNSIKLVSKESPSATTKMQSDISKGREKMCGRSRHFLQNFRDERRKIQTLSEAKGRANSGKISVKRNFLTSLASLLFGLLFRPDGNVGRRPNCVTLARVSRKGESAEVRRSKTGRREGTEGRDTWQGRRGRCQAVFGLRGEYGGCAREGAGWIGVKVRHLMEVPALSSRFVFDTRRLSKRDCEIEARDVNAITWYDVAQSTNEERKPRKPSSQLIKSPQGSNRAPKNQTLVYYAAQSGECECKSECECEHAANPTKKGEGQNLGAKSNVPFANRKSAERARNRIPNLFTGYEIEFPFAALLPRGEAPRHSRAIDRLATGYRMELPADPADPAGGDRPDRHEVCGSNGNKVNVLFRCSGIVYAAEKWDAGHLNYAFLADEDESRKLQLGGGKGGKKNADEKSSLHKT
ncbi:hypothetical protein DBV15_02711 [Temnothorax longispinosus]|uniref:Uncharacterized protein n=1 Tax=Temnothorax longispinosus TaxID=300112 RepID=A0A4S2KEF5_9HYME|nr:hypothetical protein DBV15_02711 [Temnothorax longispinosus]